MTFLPASFFAGCFTVLAAMSPGVQEPDCSGGCEATKEESPNAPPTDICKIEVGVVLTLDQGMCTEDPLGGCAQAKKCGYSVLVRYKSDCGPVEVDLWANTTPPPGQIGGIFIDLGTVGPKPASPGQWKTAWRRSDFVPCDDFTTSFSAKLEFGSESVTATGAVTCSNCPS